MLIGIGSLETLSKSDIQSMIIVSAQRQGVDPLLALAVAAHESGFNPNATHTNPTTGSTDWGVMQLNDSTYPGLGVTDPLNPQQNIDAGVSLLARYNSQYSGDTTKMLWAYAAGPGSVQKGTPPAMLPGYVDWIGNWMNQNSSVFGFDSTAPPATDFSSADSGNTVLNIAGYDLSLPAVLIGGGALLVGLWYALR